MATAGAIGGSASSGGASGSLAQQLYQQQQKNTQDLVETVTQGTNKRAQETLAAGGDGTDSASDSGSGIADSALGAPQAG